ncbi:hypothetical protein PVAND_005368 [Polypedilum vanderplanki]|uniref:CHK kinase-like domain-containing protein n=1 Tax=Polypedilum vanderplanki TaxID=319348 RepID=A0A9J6C0D2_POLVA|nr:hypothetical protein PVAND_005368 [Polypedilum vanderplanki]
MESRDEKSISFLNSDIINDDFFIDIVERKLKITRDEFKLRLVFISPATGKNENYASVVYRAKISIEINESKERKFVNVIIKALLITIEEMKEFAIFEREIVVYEKVIGSYEELLAEKTNEIVEFGPKCLNVISKPYEIIVLEDLKATGYEMLDRKVGVNFDQAKLVVEKLAKFHAASAVCYQKDGQVSNQLDRLEMLKTEAMSSPDQFKKSAFAFGLMFQEFVKSASTIEGCEKISTKLAQWDMMRIFGVFMAVAEPMTCGFKVLNHGDDWLNNMLFKSDENGKTIDVKFIDFQMSFWGSPANDLIYFFVSSIADDIKTKHYDDLIEIYHSKLVECLKALVYDQHIPTLSELQIDLIEKSSAFGFHMMFVLFIAKYDSNDDLDIEQIMNPDKVNYKVIYDAFNNEIYKNALKTWLPFLNKRGYLDTLLPHAPATPFMQAIMQQMAQAAGGGNTSEAPQMVNGQMHNSEN